MTTDRYNWSDVRHAADLFFLALSDACPQVIPLDAIGFRIIPGSLANGRSGSIEWRPSHLTARIPGGETLPRSARDAYHNLAMRTRMTDDLPTTNQTPTRKG